MCDLCWLFGLLAFGLGQGRGWGWVLMVTAMARAPRMAVEESVCRVFVGGVVDGVSYALPVGGPVGHEKFGVSLDVTEGAKYLDVFIIGIGI